MHGLGQIQNIALVTRMNEHYLSLIGILKNLFADLL
jgi:hypothetical protein